MSRPLDDYQRDPVMLEELTLLTTMMIAASHEPKPLGQERVDRLLGVERCRVPRRTAERRRSRDRAMSR